jgi:predicted nucleotide-binding protein (sugar kinase/HSP70/actin superfamily)
MLKRVMEHLFIEYAKIQIDEKKDVPTVYLIGEFFVVLDPYSNMDIEKELGHMGVEVQRQIMLSKWLEKVLKPSFLYRKESHRQRSLNYAKGFIKRAIGGECLESVGDAVYAAKNNVDGVIHLSPFNCTPEVVAQNILPKVREQEGIPILSLMLDEFTGRAGYITRLEAFVDLIKRGKIKQKVSVN